ncbi:50S ribosomal protein L24 [Candidatus Gottesmanbacteria bacterium]|nr:50S ribosomal protein L24 [Candidatus Gottesmanbacteria bacterium]
MKIKKGDTIVVTAGKEKGKKGKVERVLAKEESVVVLGINIYKRHRKKRDEKTPGGIMEYPRPLPTGNVAVLCPSCKQPTRVGYMVHKGTKVRICRKCEGKL